jgi:inorganic pyrophosphatase
MDEEPASTDFGPMGGEGLPLPPQQMEPGHVRRGSVNATDYLGQRISVRMDRPLGSKHPEWDFDYPVNYGYVPGILAPDGEELDAYLLGVNEPMTDFEGTCIAVIHRLDDDDDKLVVVPEGMRLSDKEILSLTHFQEQWFTSVILRSAR